MFYNRRLVGTTMSQWHGSGGRKPSGGHDPAHQKKRRSEIGRDPDPTTVGDGSERVRVRVRGGNEKTRLVSAGTANVVDPDAGEAQQAEIENVVENEANPHYVRRNIITKGAVLETDVGRARVTSRPGQHGTVDAVLVDEE
jgi:small subunit ribosomal protein S8e